MIPVATTPHGIDKGAEAFGECRLRGSKPGVQFLSPYALGSGFANGESDRTIESPVYTIQHLPDFAHFAIMASLAVRDILLQPGLPNGKTSLLLKDELHRFFDVHYSP